RESKLDEFKPYLCRRWNEGIRDASVLHAELRQQGWNGSVQSVRRYLAPFRKTDAAPEAPPAVPKTRQITRLLLTRPDHLQPGEQAQLADIRAQCPHLDSLAGHVSAFAEMMENLTGSTGLDKWLAAAEADDQPELRSFATGIRNDKEAVINGLTLPYSSARSSSLSRPSPPSRCRRSPATQFSSVPGTIPSSLATCAIDLPVSRTRRTAPSLKSGSNFLRVSAIAPPHLRRCVHVTRRNS